MHSCAFKLLLRRDSGLSATVTFLILGIYVLDCGVLWGACGVVFWTHLVFLGSSNMRAIRSLSGSSLKSCSSNSRAFGDCHFPGSRSSLCEGLFNS